MILQSVIMGGSSAKTRGTMVWISKFPSLPALVVALSLVAIFGENSLKSFLLPSNSSEGEVLSRSFPERFGVPKYSSSRFTDNWFKNADASLFDSTKAPFDYNAFWLQAKEVAFSNNQSLAKRMKTYDLADLPCPKVYIYNLSDNFRDSEANPTWQSAFGSPQGMNGYLRKTNQWGFAKILENRLRSSSSCTTENPVEADLFFVPILTDPKSTSQWSKACTNENRTVDRLLKELVFLTTETACHHFFVVSKGHYVAMNCSGWFANPVPILQNALRLSYSHPYKIDSNTKPKFAQTIVDATGLDFPNLFSVPYPSNLHLNSNFTGIPPWADFQAPRPHLMRYIGSDSHGDVQVRQMIVALCRSYHNELICPSDISFSFAQLLKKQKTLFCLEPIGDSPWRRSLADSISFGCIPVLFSSFTDDTSPFAWGDWKVQARVLVPRQDFVEGRIDLYQLLSSIPSDLLDLMQSTIAQYGRRFLYSLDDDPLDGIRATLHGLHNQSLYACQV